MNFNPSYVCGGGRGGGEAHWITQNAPAKQPKTNSTKDTQVPQPDGSQTLNLKHWR